MNAMIHERRMRVDPIEFGRQEAYHFTVEPFSDSKRRAERCHLRMMIVLAATTIMGLCDLYFTVTYMTTVGMVEINPLARLIVSLGNIPALVIFKIILMALSAAMLYIARGHRAAEPIAWTCAIILLGLMIHWANYNRDVVDLTNEMAVLAMDGPSPGFIRVGS